MNTFFEKLTGTKAPVSVADISDGDPDTEDAPEKESAGSPPAPKKTAPRRVPSPARQKSETHIKVEPEESSVPEEAENDAIEEEGELTVDIYDAGDSIVIQSTVAGVKPENLDVSITSDTVTIRGRREKMEEVREEHYYYKELFWGSFSRSVILPEEIDDTAAEATMKHGLLTIRLPKKRKGIAQKLKVKVT